MWGSEVVSAFGAFASEKEVATSPDRASTFISAESSVAIDGLTG